MIDLADSHPRRVLVFGGTFDPPHIAHAQLAAQAAEQLYCDLILFVPAYRNPLKSEDPGASNEHRLAMLLLAVAELPRARISTVELDRGGPSYTVETLRALANEYPAAEFRLLIGSDQALDFHRWKDWQEILRLATPAVMIRPPFNEQSFRAALRGSYDDMESRNWLSWTLRLPRLDVSATDIRRCLRENGNGTLRQLLAPAVLEYIRANHLYGVGMD